MTQGEHPQKRAGHPTPPSTPPPGYATKSNEPGQSGHSNPGGSGWAGSQWGPGYHWAASGWGEKKYKWGNSAWGDSYSTWGSAVVDDSAPCTLTFTVKALVPRQDDMPISDFAQFMAETFFEGAFCIDQVQASIVSYRYDAAKDLQCTINNQTS